MSEFTVNDNIDDDLFETQYKFPEWYSKKQYLFYNQNLRRLKKLRYLHARSSQYYDKLNFYILAPAIGITALSGIASFLSTSQYIDDGSQNAFGIGVGIIASLSSVLQSIGGACQYGAKTEAHRTVAEQYNNLIIRLKFEIDMPNEEDFLDKFELEILDIQNKCKYFVPHFILEEYTNKKESHPIYDEKQVKINVVENYSENRDNNLINNRNPRNIDINNSDNQLNNSDNQLNNSDNQLKNSDNQLKNIISESDPLLEKKKELIV